MRARFACTTELFDVTVWTAVAFHVHALVRHDPMLAQTAIATILLENATWAAGTVDMGA